MTRGKPKNGILVFTGNSNPDLAKAICAYLKLAVGSADVGRFSEGEIRLKVNDDVRGQDVFVIQSTSPPANDNLMELLIFLDALRRSSASRITAVMPYYGYARQDRKDQPRVPITAKLVANLLVGAGAQRVLSMDMHAGQIQGFFDIPVDHLYAAPVFINYFKRPQFKNLVVVSPDVGGIKMARAFAKRLHAELAIVDKRRVSDEEAEVMNLLGEVRGRTAVIVDDIVATGGSLCEAAHALKKHGAQDIYAAVTHPVLSGPAMERIAKAPLQQLVVTDTIPLGPGRRHRKIKVLSVAPLLGEAIRRIHLEESVSSLFV
ncbi:MAG: ribose-phosphate pyrophosphokinase [Candidatus Omnitrophica bacterium]|nr:ribose-phosphate pyrophosphokinase [Candidatus Omnitrophota bacterium]